MMDLIISSATHRSGSTLLQRIFNARKKTLIWGENGGCLTPFSKMHENAIYYAHQSKPYRDAYFQGGEDPNNWIAFMTPQAAEVERAVIQSVKAFHHQMYEDQYRPEHDIIGYKEVRYGKAELDLLRKCYPDCTVMLLVRHPVDVWRSASQNAKINRYGSVYQFANLWNRRVADYWQLAKDDPYMHFVKYEDIISRDQQTMRRIRQVGHLQQPQIKNSLANKISSSSRPITNQQQKVIQKQCHIVMQKVGYQDEE